MPHFSAKGNDEYICQKCATILDSVDYPPQDRPDITGNTTATNVCPSCVRKFENGVKIPKPTRSYRPDDQKDQVMSLHEYCHIESGGLTGMALDRYINRYYGHS